MGRPAEDVIRMFKYLLLKNYYKLSDVGLIERTRTDMLFKYFLEYEPEETKLIDPSLLTVFRRERLDDSKTEDETKTATDLMDKLIRKTVEIAIEKGLIEVKNKIIIDSTHTNAMFSRISPREELIRKAKDLRKEMYRIDESYTKKVPKKRETSGLLEDQLIYTKELLEVAKGDERFTAIPQINEKINYLEEIMMDTNIELEYSKEQDARVGHKTADTSFFGFKTHIAMTPERIITGVVITSGEKHDGKQLEELVNKSEALGIQVEAVIGDSAYSEEDNLAFCENKEIKNISKLSKTVTHGLRKENNEFEYNKDAQMYVCPSGHMAIKIMHQKGNKHNNYSEVDSYFFDVEKCKHCPKKDGCYKDGANSKTYNVTIKKEIHTKHMDYMETDEFKEFYKERYKIEAKNGEIKNSYGYSKANGCGKIGMTIQGASTLFLLNMKRINKIESQKTKIAN
jgi:hypothetical protein